MRSRISASFKNTWRQNIMISTDNVPSETFPTGVLVWIFDVPQSPPDAERLANFFYLGVLRFERGFNLAIEWFPDNSSRANVLLLVVRKPAGATYRLHRRDPPRSRSRACMSANWQRRL